RLADGPWSPMDDQLRVSGEQPRMSGGQQAYYEAGWPSASLDAGRLRPPPPPRDAPRRGRPYPDGRATGEVPRAYQPAPRPGRDRARGTGPRDRVRDSGAYPRLRDSGGQDRLRDSGAYPRLRDSGGQDRLRDSGAYPR